MHSEDTRASGQPAATTQSPRLLGLKAAAAYLGISFWSLRDYAASGILPTVTLPPLRPRPGGRAKPNLRRVLVDKADLDAFVEARKVRSAGPLE